MIEKYEFRIFGRYGNLFRDLISDATESAYGVVVVRGVIGDDAYRSLEEIERKLRAEALRKIFASWKITRSYSLSEIEDAELFLLRVPYRQVSAEDYGTRYSESSECQQESFTMDPDWRGSQFGLVPIRVPCGLCSKQETVVRVPIDRFQARDIYRLVGGELLVSERIRELFEESDMQGADWYTVERTGRRRLQLDGDLLEFWQEIYLKESRGEVTRTLLNHATSQLRGEANTKRHSIFQLWVKSLALEVAPGTRFGDDPFDENSGGRYFCRSGEIAGRNLLSSLKVRRSSWDGSDVCQTQLFVGARQGYYRPYRPLVVSKRLFGRLREEKIRGFEFEIVELV